jgi:UDP-N-acetylmuramate--alanine ligase
VVVEADEFDRSFHQLSPDIAVITAVDTDHLDIYGTKENIDDAFVIFSQKLKANGPLFVNSEVSIIPRLDAAVLQLYSTKTHQGLHVSHYSVKHGAYHVDIKNDVIGNEFHGHFILRLGGMHNVENALAAIAVGLQMGIAFDKIASAMESFKGIHRRFETIVNNGRVVYIDDYAHHPKEISSFLSALREMYPGKKITALFQPHLFSRTKDLAEGFAQSLSMVDELYLLDIYPARELPMEGVTSALILDKVQLPKKHITSKQEFLEIVADSDIEVLATIGAGDIDQLVQPLKELLSQR